MKVASQKFAEMLDLIETSKIRAYIHILLSDNPQNLAKETQIISQLESDMNRKMYDDNYVGFFLTTLSYYLNCHNRTVFHMHESKLGSLKAKFLDMQIALDQRDIKPDNIPLMLNMSIRTGKISAAPTDLPFTSQFEVQRIPSMLISELRSNFLEDYNIWQDYFVKNVNNKFEIQLSETPTNALKKTFGVIGSLFSKKPTKKMELLKQVEARKDYYKSAISEIGMMLCNLQMDAWKAISILKQLSETFDIDTSSLEHIYQIFRSITAERVEKEAFKTVWTKRNSILQSLESKRAGSSRLPSIFERVLPYLDHRSISELFRLKKQVSRDFGLTLSINQMNSLSNLNFPSESKPRLYMKIIDLKLSSKQTTQRILQNMRKQGNTLKRLEDCKLTKYSMGLLENDAKRTSSAPETVAVGL